MEKGGVMSDHQERRMPDPFRDNLDIRDKEVEIGLRCAKCKELVKSGEEHNCKQSAVSSEQKEKTDEDKETTKTD